MGAHRYNDLAVIGSACDFLEAGHIWIGNAVEGWVLAACAVRIIAAGSGDTDNKYICS